MSPDQRAAFLASTESARRQALASAPPSVSPETARILRSLLERSTMLPQLKEAASGAA